MRPALPRNRVTWDIGLVFAYIRTLGPSEHLTLKMLTLKLNILLCLLVGQRGQTISLFHVDNITLTKDSVTVRVGDIIKTSKPGKHIGELHYPAFHQDKLLCVVEALSVYLKKTQQLRGQNKKLLISYVKPHEEVSRATIARWTKVIMTASGIDMNIFTPHSTRAAANSAAAVAKVPLQTILSTAGWSSEQTFAQYYNKPIQHKASYANALLLQNKIN